MFVINLSLVDQDGVKKANCRRIQVVADHLVIFKAHCQRHKDSTATATGIKNLATWRQLFYNIPCNRRF